MTQNIKPEDLNEQETKELWDILAAGSRKAFESEEEYQRVMERIKKKRELFNTKDFPFPTP